MKKQCSYLPVILIFILLIAAASPPLLHPLSQQDVSPYEKRLTEIANQIKDLRKKIDAEEKKESTILSTLGKIGFNKRLIRKEISFYNTQLNKANKELEPIKKSIPPLKAKLEREKESLGKTLVTLYKFGRLSYINLLFQVEDVGKFITENKNLEILAQHQEKIISGYRITLTDLRTAENRLEEKKQEIQSLLQKAEAKRGELTIQEKRNRALIIQIERNKETHMKALEELRDRAEQLQLLIKKLEKEEISLPEVLIPLYEKKRNLPWPAEGKIVTHFGLQRHSRFNTITQNNGIEISPAKEMVARAIHTGKVVYADYFQGYGNLVILDHGMTYYSLYGHCADFLVDKGDFVAANQPLAVVGDFGSLKGNTLYFEIRYKTKPLNPLQWLKRR
jgi:septal ring factor EnvC (AmiA/AmiB activator)